MNDYVMQLVPVRTQTKIKQVLNVFETGSIKGDYANVTVYHDGKNNTRQITYGKTQTTEQGNLRTLIASYIDHHGFYADSFRPYLPKIGVTPLGDNNAFINLLRRAGNDPVMQHTEDSFFDNLYYFPACGFFSANRFSFPLSLLVIYDSYIQSGGILSFLRNKFATRTPAYMGDEKTWIQNYVITRHQWLLCGAEGTRPLLAKTCYRTACLLDQVRQGNWQLEEKIRTQGVMIG